MPLAKQEIKSICKEYVDDALNEWCAKNRQIVEPWHEVVAELTHFAVNALQKLSKNYAIVPKRERQEAESTAPYAQENQTQRIMTQIATNPKQCVRLIACGVDPKSANMGRIHGGCGSPVGFQEICNINEYEYWNGSLARGLCAGPDGKPLEIQPPLPYKIEYAWSLSALLALLPKEITDDNGDNYYFSIAQEFPLSCEYGVSYKPCWYDSDALTRTHDNSPIEACVQMIEWLTNNRYKLNHND